MKERLSVVITCYREGHLLDEAVRSAQAQSTAADEIIVVNDASPDAATNDVFRHLESASQARLLWRESNGGPSAARNTGFAAAQGEILVPLDADDLLPPNAVADVHEAFAQYPDAGFIHGAYVRQNAPGRECVVPSRPLDLRTLLQPRRFSFGTDWTLLGTAPLRRRLWTAVGECDAAMGAEDLHDVDFWIRALALPCTQYAIPSVIYIWRKYLGRNSRRVTPLAWQRIAQKHFEIYQRIGLEYRARELLLVGAKCANAPADVAHHRQALLRLIGRDGLRASTILALLPAQLLRFAARIAAARR
jgi:glycosyltransferase involved in cell wall biosynthesis